MKCLYCGKRILAFRLFSGGETFCSEEHGNLYRKNEAESAIQRILTLDPPKKARLTPAPVVAIMPPPTLTEPEPPPMAGFRLPVLEAHNHAGETSVCPLPISLEILTPVYATSAVDNVGAVTGFHQLAWSGGTAAPHRVAEPLPAPQYQRVPSTPLPAFALSDGSPLQTLTWVPRPDSFGQGEASGLLTAERTCAPVSVLAPQPFTLAFASVHVAWPALADGSASLSVAGSLEPAVAIATPCLTLERFTPTWTAQRVLPLWLKGCSDIVSGQPAFTEVSSSLPGSLRLPFASADRDARPSATAPALLWRIVSGRPSLTAEITTQIRYQLPELAGSSLGLALGRLDGLSLVPCRPFPWIPRVVPEPAAAPSLWSAWPELPTARLAPTQHAAAVANGHSWKPVNGTPGLVIGRSNASGLRLLDAPERCRAAALTLPVDSSALRRTAPASDPLGINAVLPAPLVSPLALPISPRETVLAPAHAVPATHQPLAIVPAWGIAPEAQVPLSEVRPVAKLGREEIALRIASQWPEAGATVARPLSAVPLLPAFRFSANAPKAEHAGAPLLAESHECNLTQPAQGGAVVAGLRNFAKVPQGWGETTDSRPLEAVLPQQRETPLRLSVEEIPCRCTLEVPPPAALPTQSAWTVLALSSALPARDLPLAELASPGQALCAPGVWITCRAVSVAAAAFRASAWAGLTAAPEPVVRRRQLPASRPKMNLPRLRPLQGSIALPGLTQLAAILATESLAVTTQTQLELTQR